MPWLRADCLGFPAQRVRARAAVHRQDFPYLKSTNPAPTAGEISD